MSEHKFKAFLRSRQWNENQSKYFVDQALTQSTLPDAKSWEELKDYLEGNDAVPRAIEEAKYIYTRLYAPSQAGHFTGSPATSSSAKP